MTKKELFDALKDVPDDTEIMISNIYDAVEVIGVTILDKVQTVELDDHVLCIKKYCAENEYFDAIVLS